MTPAISVYLRNKALKKNIKGDIAKSAAVAATAAAIIGGGLTDDDDGISQLVQKELSGHEPKIEYVDSSEPVRRIELNEDSTKAEEKTALWKSILAAPLWALTHLLTTLLSPLLGKVLSWLLLAAAMLAIIAFAIHKVFPDMPLKDVLSKKTVVPSLIAAALLIVSDWILGAFCPDYIRWKNVFRLIFGLALVMAVIIRRCRKLGRKKAATLVLPQTDF